MAMMEMTAGLMGLNILLLAGLFYIYYQNYKELKVKFSVGLIAFSLIMLLQKLVSLYFVTTRMVELESDFGNQMFIMELFQLVAFSILLWITYE